MKDRIESIAKLIRKRKYTLSIVASITVIILLLNQGMFDGLDTVTVISNIIFWAFWIAWIGLIIVRAIQGASEAEEKDYYRKYPEERSRNE
jgi:hypothetical protein